MNRRLRTLVIIISTAALSAMTVSSAFAGSHWDAPTRAAGGLLRGLV
jgi:hypothetical protein